MTGPAPAPAAAPLTREGRLQLLLDLHHQAGTITHAEWRRRLRAYTAVPWNQAVAGWQVHEQTVAKVRDLRCGASAENYPELPGDLWGWTPEQRREAAIEWFENEARDVMWRLASGES